MKHLKQTLLTLLLALIGANAWADNPIIVIWFSDGNKTEVLFNDTPEFSYADGYVTMQSNNPSTTLSWPIESLLKLTFEGIDTDIKEVKTGLDIHSDKMTVYDLNGKMIKKNIKSLSELPKGVYIVKDGRVTTKVERK
jgi:hypothetical protein